MKILAIRGQNLASLKGEFGIDLSVPPLSHLGLFAIAGPVGAGKSTILDAMCLALFARTPRLTGRGGAPLGDGLKTHDPRSLVRKGAATAFAEVDFKGKDGKPFRARWEVRRARGAAFGRMLDAEHTLTCRVTGARFGSTNSEVREWVEEMLGLGFDEMCRSVILSQGGFTAFLQAPAEERAALLEKITGTEIYSVTSRLAFERAKQAQLTLTSLMDERDALPALDDAARAVLDERIATLAGDRIRMDDDVRARARVIEKREERKARVVAERRARGALESALERAERARNAEQQVAADLTSATPLLLRARALDTQLAALDVAATRARTAAAEAAATSSGAAAERVRQERAAISADLAAADELIARDAAVAAIVPAWETLSADLSRLVQMDTDIEGQRALSAMRAREQDERMSAHARIVEQLAACVGDAGGRAGLAAELVVERRSLEFIERVTERYEERVALKDGEPCPLCGALDHPVSHDLQSADLASRDAQRQRVAHLEERIRMFDALTLDQKDAELGLADTKASLEFLRGQEQARSDERARVVASLERTLAPLSLGANALARPASLARNLSMRKQAVMGAQERAVQAKLALDHGEARLVDAERTAAAARALVDVSRAAFADVTERARAVEEERASVFAGRPADDVERVLDQRRNDARAASDDARAALATATEALRTAEAELARFPGSPALDADDAAQDAAFARARSALEMTMREEAQSRAALVHDNTARARRNELAPRVAAQEEATRTWSQLSQLIGSHDGARFRVFAQSLTLDTLVHHANQHLTALAPRYRLERMRNDGSSSLPSVRRPTSRLELCVVDRDNGDELRGVQSLSGGESFLVSLALALGLSSLSSARSTDASARLPVESLFIDEGFSSLDPDTLETALAAFEALQQSGRQIGVISHLPALAERIGSQVRVLPLGDGRSRVEVKAG